MTRGPIAGLSGSISEVRVGDIPPIQDDGLWRSLVSALRSGRRGRRFKSGQPDHMRAGQGLKTAPMPERHLESCAPCARPVDDAVRNDLLTFFNGIASQGSPIANGDPPGNAGQEAEDDSTGSSSHDARFHTSRDDGPATEGGASKTQKVQITPASARVHCWTLQGERRSVSASPSNAPTERSESVLRVFERRSQPMWPLVTQ
jgi:hypothetical protein